MNLNSRLFRTMLLLVLMNGCLIETPESPTWELDLVVPLIDEKYPLRDMVGPISGDSSNGYIDIFDSLDILRLNVKDSIGTIVLDSSKLTVGGIGTIPPIVQDIGALELNDFGSGQEFESQTLSEISSEVAGAPNGFDILVPAFILDPISNKMAMANIVEATMEEGIIQISIKNGFIDAPNEGIPLTNMKIVLSDSMGTKIDSALYERIGPDSTETRGIDLAGKTFFRSPGEILSQLSISAEFESGLKKFGRRILALRGTCKLFSMEIIISSVSDLNLPLIS